jgi:hypothetical protein
MNFIKLHRFSPVSSNTSLIPPSVCRGQHPTFGCHSSSCRLELSIVFLDYDRFPSSIVNDPDRAFLMQDAPNYQSERREDVSYDRHFGAWAG